MATQGDAPAQAAKLLGPGAAEALAREEWDWDMLMPGAVTWDSEGRGPRDPEWVPTYDSHWLAALAAQQLARWSAGSDTTLKLSVDGDSRETRPADWLKVADSLFESSALYRQGDLFVAGGLTSYIPTSIGLGD